MISFVEPSDRREADLARGAGGCARDPTTSNRRIPISQESGSIAMKRRLSFVFWGFQFAQVSMVCLEFGARRVNYFVNAQRSALR